MIISSSQVLRAKAIARPSSPRDLSRVCFSCLSTAFDDRRRRKSPLPRLPRYVSLGNHLMCAPNLGRHGQTREISWLPEAVQNFSIWGGTGIVLKTIHMDGTIPYWACFGAMSVALRTALTPLVIYSAKTSARFAKVAPELQFIITLFQNDLKKMRAEGKSLFEQRQLFLQNIQTVQSIYKLHNINPLVVFMSPILQIPFFYYVAVDLRKIVNGQDPELAQELTESGFYWVPDLTDPDPWFGLPIAAGAMLYLNVEIAVGRRSLSGPTTSKSDFAGLLKDLFQSLAVMMPCLASQSPAGLQIYLLSSFTWTLFQGAALRNDPIRASLGLPSMDAPPTEAKYAKEFMEFKRLEQKAKEVRGDGPVLGKNVLAVGFETSFPGSNRPSTIEGSGQPPPDMLEDDESTAALGTTKPRLDVTKANAAWGGHFIHGVSAPMEQLEAQFAAELKEAHTKDLETQMKAAKNTEPLAQVSSEEAMQAANKGAILAPPESRSSPASTPAKLDATKFKRNAKKAGRKKR